MTSSKDILCDALTGLKEGEENAGRIWVTSQLHEEAGDRKDDDNDCEDVTLVPVEGAVKKVWNKDKSMCREELIKKGKDEDELKTSALQLL